MRHDKFGFGTVLFLLVIGIFGSIGCGGSGGQVGGPPPPPPKTVTSVTASANPTTLQEVSSGSQPTSTITATVHYSDGTSDSAATLTMSPTSAGTLSSGVFTPAVVTSTEKVTFTATATADVTQKGTVDVTVDPAPVAPTIALDTTSATVAFGNSKSFTITTLTGTPVPTVSCKVAGTGTCSVSGTTVNYNVSNPAAAPASFSDTLTVTAQNSAGTVNAQATITLVASITSAAIHSANDPSMLFCARYNCSATIDMTGTGFFAGTSQFLQDLTATSNSAASVADSAHATMTILVSKTDYESKAFHVGVRQPGPCCGFDSNVANFVFTGNQNMLATSSTEAFLLEQATGTIWKFKLVDGSADGNCNFGLPTFGVAYDVVSKYLVGSGTTGFGATDTNCTNVGTGFFDGNMGLSVSAGGGYMFGSEDQGDQVTTLQLKQFNSAYTALAIGNTPTTTGMLTLSGSNQLAGVSINAGDLKFSVVPVPIPSQNPAPLWTLTVSGFTPLNQITSPPNGGWPLAAFQAAQKVAILSWFDKKVAVVDLASKTQTQTVSLTGHLLQMAADDVHGKAIVATANLSDETSSFLSVDLSTGTVTTLTNKAPFYCGALGVSADGTQIYCGLGSQFKIIANQ